MSECVNLTNEDIEKLKNYNIQLITVGCLTKEQADDFTSLINKALNRVEQLKEWYDSLMEFSITDGTFKCNHCGGPVAVTRCCAWCGNKSPAEEYPSF